MASRLVLVALAVALTACSGIPSSGPATVVRRVPTEGPEPPEPQVERVLPPNPPADATPDEIVRNFLLAQSEQPADNYAAARRYLTPQAQWDVAGRTVVYTSRRVTTSRPGQDAATVSVSLDPLGVLTPAGEFQPRAEPVRTAFRLTRVPDVGWRIAEAPAGLLLEDEDVARSFHRVTLYWTDQARRLVPDLQFLRAGDQRVGAVVRALLAGPRGWLAPAVRTSIPQGTTLLDTPEVVGDVVTLNFSRELTRGTPRENLGSLVAQVVWTVTDGNAVNVVRMLVEGQPLDVPARPQLRDHRRGDWVEYAPVPATADRRLFFVRNGEPHAVDDAGRPSRVAPTEPLSSFAVNRSGTALAAVTAGAGQQSLAIHDLTGAEPPTTEVTAERISQPTWEPGGGFVWAVQTNGPAQQVVAVPVRDGLFDVVRVPAALPGPITALRLSPDGARVALVAGSGRSASLWVARVERPPSGGRVLGDPVRLAPSVGGVTAVAFEGSAHLVVASWNRRRATVHRVAVDGYALEVLRGGGLPPQPVTALAVSVGTPPDRIAASGGRLWRRTPAATWAAFERGTAPTFAG